MGASIAQRMGGLARLRKPQHRTREGESAGQLRAAFQTAVGQFKADSGGFFASQGLHVALWNIDSQDWNDKISADDVRQRVLTLMLLWRHGILLPHDIHPKAQVAVPWLVQQLDQTQIRWLDCAKFLSTTDSVAR